MYETCCIRETRTLNKGTYERIERRIFRSEKGERIERCTLYITAFECTASTVVWACLHGHRRRGCPRNRWLDNVREHTIKIF
ncbi:hypothetical protein O3M35_002166 [Rhynocoris fuscipes]|uniref:Uncharacterized protein n=1 Tax=Rhynocoris fuscipes TaxID=488301 RepID=A0AAW1CTT1_9HEMI